MQTIKRFRAWKNNRLIPEAIPLNNTQIIVGAYQKNGQELLRIETVDAVEQLFNNGFYEGDIVAFINNRYNDEVNVALIGLSKEEDTSGDEYYTQHFTEFLGIKLDKNLVKKFEEELWDYLLVGNIHLDKAPNFENKDYWTKKVTLILKQMEDK